MTPKVINFSCIMITHRRMQKEWCESANLSCLSHFWGKKGSKWLFWSPWEFYSRAVCKNHLGYLHRVTTLLFPQTFFPRGYYESLVHGPLCGGFADHTGRFNQIGVLVRAHNKHRCRYTRSRGDFCLKGRNWLGIRSCLTKFLPWGKGVHRNFRGDALHSIPLGICVPIFSPLGSLRPNLGWGFFKTPPPPW